MFLAPESRDSNPDPDRVRPHAQAIEQIVVTPSH